MVREGGGSEGDGGVGDGGEVEGRSERRRAGGGIGDEGEELRFGCWEFRDGDDDR